MSAGVPSVHPRRSMPLTAGSPASLRNGDKVAAVQRDWPGLCLDGCRCLEARALDLWDATRRVA